MHDVFISYSHKDVQIADALCHQFEAEGIRCWYAPRNITPGEEWADAIVKALEETKVMVLIFTDYSNTSVQVQREVDTALKNGKTVIPFKCTDTEPTGGMKYYLATLHWLDAMTESREKSIENLRVHVQRLLSGEEYASQPTYSVPDPETARIGKKSLKPFVFILVGILVIAAVVLVLVLNKNKTKEEETPKETAKSEITVTATPAPEITEEAIETEPPVTEDTEAVSEETADSPETVEESAQDKEKSPGAAVKPEDSPGAGDYLITKIKGEGQLGICLDVYFGEEKSVIEVPEIVEGLPVIKIGEKCFEGCQYIEKIVLPETLTFIDYRAFYGCSNLSEMNLPASLTGCGGWAFALTGFSNIVLPEGFKDLGYGAFWGSKNLETVVLSENVKKISKDTFKNITPLQSVTIPAKDIEIESFAFEKNDDVTIIGVKGSYAEKYANGMGLSFEPYGDSAENYEETDTASADELPYFYSTIIRGGQQGIQLDVYFGEETSEIVIPDVVDGLPVMDLGEKLFANCVYLEKVTLPKTLRYIDNLAFRGCENLSEIEFPSTLTGAGTSAFNNTALTDVVFPAGFKDLGSMAFYNCKQLRTVVLSDQVTEIKTDTFTGENCLVSVTIPSPDIEIASGAFAKGKDMTIIGVKGSFSEKYAKAMGIAFEEYKG